MHIMQVLLQALLTAAVVGRGLAPEACVRTVVVLGLTILEDKGIVRVEDQARKAFGVDLVVLTVFVLVEEGLRHF